MRIDEGQWLVREGEAPAFYVLLSGTYDLMKRYGDELRRLAVRDEPGEYLGELPIVLGTPFFAGARATTPLRVARFDPPQFGADRAGVGAVARAHRGGDPEPHRGSRVQAAADPPHRRS